MTAKNIGSLIVNVLANTAGFTLGGPRKELSAFEKSVVGLNRTAGMIKGALVTVGAAIGASKIASEIRSVSDALGDLNDFAGRIGIATDKLMGLQYGAKFVGVSAEEMQGALNVMTKQIGEAIHGGGKAKEVFAAMGVDLRKLARDKPEEAFKRIADNIKALGSEEEQLRATLRIFGQDGGKLLNFLRQGSQGIGAFVKEAEKLGVSIKQEDIAKVDELGDAMDKLGAVWQGVKNAVVIEIAEPAKKAVDDLTLIMNWLRKPSPGSPSVSVTDRAYRSLGPTGMLYQAVAPSAFNNLAIASGVATSLPAIQPSEVKHFDASGQKFSQAYLDARKKWFDATRQWEIENGMAEGMGYIQKTIPRPQYLNDLAQATRDALESSPYAIRVTPNSNQSIANYAVNAVTGASSRMQSGVKSLGEILKRYEGVGRESYYEMLLNKLWPEAKKKTNDTTSVRNQLTEATTAEGYALLRSNLRSNPQLEQAKKQTGILAKIEANTKQFAVASTGL